jgi:hypothetical protein
MRCGDFPFVSAEFVSASEYEKDSVIFVEEYDCDGVMQ